MMLTDKAVKAAKPKEKQYKITDGRGLFLLVLPTGGKYWHFRSRVGGKAMLISFGTYPETTLAEAREKRETARKQLANGIDPREVRKAQKIAHKEALANTFQSVALEWHKRFSIQWSTKYAKTTLIRLEQDVFPYIGARPIGGIKVHELLTVLQRIETRTRGTAHRVKTSCGQIFRYAIATGRADHNPSADLAGILLPVKYRHMAAPTDPKKVAPLLKAIDGFTGTFVVKCAMQLAPLLFVRPGELRHAEWAEIDFDAAEWRIPGKKMKMGIDHLVPLSSQALEILKALHSLTGAGKYVFRSRSSPQCISENVINQGLRRLGFERSEITGHGFRAMARTILDEILGFRPDIIEHQLAHAVKDPLGTAYNRTSHLVERRRMMQVWSDYLDGLKVGSDMLPIKQKKCENYSI
jgi:integrase